jgi:hypothetical protein
VLRNAHEFAGFAEPAHSNPAARDGLHPG